MMKKYDTKAVISVLNDCEDNLRCMARNELEELKVNVATVRRATEELIECIDLELQGRSTNELN